MRTVALVFLILVASQVVTTRMFTNKVYKSMTDHFGRAYQVQQRERFTHTIIDGKRPEHLFTPEYQYKNLHEMSKFILDKNALKAGPSNIIQCQPGHPDFFKFMAVTVATLKTPQDQAQYDSFCFSSVTLSLQNMEGGSVTAVLTASGKKDEYCSEAYLVSTGKHFHLFNLADEGDQYFTFTGLDAEELNYVAQVGIRFMRFCDSIYHFIPNLLKTAQMFLGGLGLDPDIPFFGSHVPEEMQKANVEFILHATGFQWRSRQDTFIDLDAQYVQSGDAIMITRFDGLDNIIHWGAGSHAGHTTMALWDHSQEPAQLYVVESQDAWYWPTAGLQRTKWEDWKKRARNADFNVVVLPLRKEFADKFDEDAAWAWFRQTQGMPYGYRNFLFGWIDTVSGNFPAPLDINFAYLVFRLGEYLNPKGINILLQEALNWRVGTTDLNFWEVEQEALKQGKTVADLFAMVETEGHMYSDGYSYVCSSYVMSFYTRALLPITASATEFTPRDVYSLDIFDTNYTRPQACIDADPELPYCQIMGAWKMDLPDYSTVTPYDHMAENCPTQAPAYLRTPGC